MNIFEKGVAEHIGHAALDRMQKTRIGIAGAGGLGSNCALILVRCGFRQFTLADFDTVSLSNLNRQYYFTDQIGKPKVDMLKENLLAVNPDLHIRAHNEKLTPGLMDKRFADCDVIVEAFDTPTAKKHLAETFLASEKLIVSASGIAGWGDSDRLLTHAMRRNFFIVGDLATPAEPGYPSMAPGVIIAAAKQADIILSHVMGGPKTKSREATHDTPVFS